MNEQKNNGRGIFYGVIGVATLVIAIIGATFAYFTATNTAGNNVITGDMATITFNLKVDKASISDEKKGGMIPMSNNMVEKALTGKTDSNSANYVCTDDNGNAVCQIYKITVENTGSASLFLDGYVTLTDDVSEVTVKEGESEKVVKASIPDYDGTDDSTDNPTDNDRNYTSMRWAQAFCTEYTAEEQTADEEDNGEDATIVAGALKSCTTEGKTTTRVTNKTGVGLGGSAWNPILDANSDTGKQDPLNLAQIAREDTDDSDGLTYVGTLANGRIVSAAKNGTIAGNTYDVIDTNFIRLSNHDPKSNVYDRTADVTSALVYNQPLDAKNSTADNTGDSNGTYTDAQVYYIVVWFTETGYNQTQGAGTADWEDDNNPDTYHFFNGSSTFISAQGSEVTATFSGYSRVARQED